MSDACKNIIHSPLVSVLIPTYNLGSLIAFTLKSLLSSSYSNYEIIIVDDGSTDNTEKVISEFADKIIYFKKNNGGLASARNKCIEMAKGEFLAFLDGDDICHKNRIAVQVDYLLKNPEVALCCTDFSAFNTLGEISKSYIKNYYGIIKTSYNGLESIYETQKKLYISEKLFNSSFKGRSIRTLSGNVFNKIIFGNFIHPPTVMVRKKIAKIVGKFDEKYIFSSDYDWLIKIAEIGKIGYIDYPFLKYRISENQMSNFKNRAQVHLETIDIIKNLKSKKLFSKIDVNKLNRRIGLCYLDAADASIKNSKKNAISYFIKSINYRKTIDLKSIKILIKLFL